MLDPDTLIAWADEAPERRYPPLCAALPLFATSGFDEITGLSPHFLALLARAQDKSACLGSPQHHIYPGSWSGSLVPVLERRMEIVSRLAELGDPTVDGAGP